MGLGFTAAGFQGLLAAHRGFQEVLSSTHVLTAPISYEDHKGVSGAH